MKTRSLIINGSMRVSLRDGDESGNFKRVSLEIKERGVCGDVALESSLNKAELKNMIEFLKRAEQVLS